MVSIASFGPGDLSLNRAGLMSWIQIKNWVFTNNTSMWYPRKYRNPAIRGILVGIDK